MLFVGAFTQQSHNTSRSLAVFTVLAPGAASSAQSLEFGENPNDGPLSMFDNSSLSLRHN